VLNLCSNVNGTARRAVWILHKRKQRNHTPRIGLRKRPCTLSMTSLARRGTDVSNFTLAFNVYASVNVYCVKGYLPSYVVVAQS